MSDCSANISELKKNPSALLSEANGAPIVILNHNKPAAYLVPAETYEWMMDALDDQELAKIVAERRQEKELAIAPLENLSLDDL
ncbi:type II toxin-antitoxin system Phd/YefM family antitoxin [Pelagibaculum spongiae]|uniref:Antitoxin n=1 Tax=Pelagibaculum spongiae TaxID=2080658 RepID=A0A2V1GZS0_9GAMM|nr:type II toxin-antitoxin system Phd/YefM family antitoxin [Pelagibaculum spongiae]PVZ68283.1 antitoxin [Pelagibaculum spongiae]